MDTLEKFKSKRATVRSAVTKLISKCDTLLLVAIEEIDPDNLTESLEILLEKEKSLKELDSEIDNLITDKNEYDKELKNVEDYSERIFTVKFKLKNKLKKCKIEVEPKVTKNNFEIESKSVSAVKLPKLSIEKFSGDPSQFLEFFNSYTNAIDANVSLSKIEKFQYLKSLLSGPAYNIVSGFELTESNYDSCLKLLHERFGKRENIITCHMNKILNLEAVKSASNVKSLRKLYDDVEISVRNLEALGVASGAYGHLLLPILLKLLPENLVLDFHRKRNPDKDTEVNELINFLKDEVRCREATNLVNNSQSKSSDSSQNNYRNCSQKKLPSATALSTSAKKFCIFCKGSDHWGLNCVKLTDEQKRFRLKKEGRCYKCFMKSHLSVNCKSKFNSCTKCGNNKHNYLFCVESNKQENSEIDKSGTIVSMMSEQKIKKNKSTILQTCCVSVSAGNNCMLARLLCDSGSEKCFVKRTVVQNLKLKPLRKEHLLVYPFGRRRPYESCYDVVALELTGVVQPCNTLTIEALVVDNITGAIVKTIDSEVLNIMRKKGYTPADTGLEQEINILLGSDYLWKIQKGIVEKLTKELYVAETIFGHTVQGQIASNEKNINCLKIICGPIENDLKCLWNLESFVSNQEIKNNINSDINVTFKEKLRFVNGRYEAPLLWKSESAREKLCDNFQVVKKWFTVLERRFKADEFERYNTVMKEQLEDGIIEACNDSCFVGYTMPHRDVFRENSSSTKTRVVYDASSKQGTNNSLNECLLSGENLNANLADVILKFREHKIGFCGALLKRLTLPRLELMGAIIAARIAKHLKEIFKNIEKVVLWSDSTIVLHWIRGSTSKWKPFVANRVTEIQEFTDPSAWRHCEGKLNPADLLTRGCSVKQLINSVNWWKAPAFLSLPENEWPQEKILAAKLPDVSEEQSRKAEPILSCGVQTNLNDNIPILNMSKYSSLKRLYRVTAWIFRFISNVRMKVEKRNFAELSAEELLHVEKFWLKLVQQECFPEEIKCLKDNKNIPKESNLLQLNPIMQEGLLLVRGRLQKAKLPFHNKHPIVIPAKHKLTELIIKDSHERVLHAGVSDTLVQTREKFWIIKGRQSIKSVLHRCIICKRFNVRPGREVIAPLPSDRINESPPFSCSGLDFAGPLYVRGSENKHYILLFTCGITRAIHLELVKDMTTSEFLLAFRRFISRRGLCSVIYSDNAKTFKRAELELKEMWKVIHHPDVKRFYATHGITWKYIAERAAWWGGFYERMVRSVKTSLRKIIGRSSFTLSELETVLIEVEAMINSRPLTYIYSELNEPSSLTPAHFLIGKRLLSLPTIKVNDLKLPATKESLVKRFRLRETCLNHFWKRWKNEYLLNLRSAHYTDQNKASVFKLNDVVQSKSFVA